MLLSFLARHEGTRRRVHSRHPGAAIGLGGDVSGLHAVESILFPLANTSQLGLIERYDSQVIFSRGHRVSLGTEPSLPLRPTPDRTHPVPSPGVWKVLLQVPPATRARSRVFGLLCYGLWSRRSNVGEHDESVLDLLDPLFDAHEAVSLSGPSRGPCLMSLQLSRFVDSLREAFSPRQSPASPSCLS